MAAAADYQKTYGVRIVRFGAAPNAFGELAVCACDSSAQVSATRFRHQRLAVCCHLLLLG
jgi:hypothetical protein